MNHKTANGVVCSLCEGTRRVQRRGYTTRCETCDLKEISELKQECARLRNVLVMAKAFVEGSGDIIKLVDAVIDYDLPMKRTP